MLFMAFTMKLSPARRMLYAISLVLALIGLINLFRGIGIIRFATLPFGVDMGVPGPLFRQGMYIAVLRVPVDEPAGAAGSGRPSVAQERPRDRARRFSRRCCRPGCSPLPVSRPSA